jgi:ABC-type Mn2+/Zn2+ transport system permease subunit
MNDLLVSPFADNPFMWRALLAGVLVAVACAVVGTFVVLRGLAFVADALAHGVLPGIATAVLIGLPATLGAAAGTAVMMGGVAVITRRSRLSSDTAIGLLFAGMLALGVMITSRSRSFTGDLTRILFGDVLGVDRSELWWQAIAVACVGGIAWVCRRPFLLLCVDPDLASTSGFRVRRYEALLYVVVAVAIISSFQSVGTLLVFGMLVAPASTAALVTRRIGAMVAVAAALGSVATYGGLLLSYHADLAAGASIVAVAVAIFVVSFAAVEIRRAMSGSAPASVPDEHHPHDHGHSHGAHVPEPARPSADGGRS